MQKDFDKNYTLKNIGWKSSNESEIIIIAIHGYNDYSNAFKDPALFFSKFEIDTHSFDLRGFGKNSNRGKWIPLNVHIYDVERFLKKIRGENPKKKIFLLGESMGAAIAIGYANQRNIDSIDGLILVAPAIWNFTEQNPIKSFILRVLSNFFPNSKVSGKGIIKVRPSDNIEMLKKFSTDPLIIKKPSLDSLNGIVELMDKSFKNAEKYFSNPKFDTLIVLPIIDEIVPRKPILSLINKKEFKENINKKIYLAVYEKNFHMILRDIDGERVSREIKEWIVNRENVSNFYSFERNLDIIENSPYYHKLD